MNSHKTRCSWCYKTYSTSGTFSNHVLSKHPKHLQSAPVLLLRRTTDSATAEEDGADFEDFEEEAYL